jgi:hypothetical protein
LRSGSGSGSGAQYDDLGKVGKIAKEQRARRRVKIRHGRQA